MDLNKKQKDINYEDDKPQLANHNTNNLYLTTTDLQKMMSSEDEKLVNVTTTK